jgi:hypothetical protein
MHQLVISTIVMTAATTSRHFHIGPWIIVPLLFLAAIIGTPIYIARDRHQRQPAKRESGDVQ